MTFRKLLLLLPCLALEMGYAAPPPESPFHMPQPPFFGQVRVRTEYDSKDVRDTLANEPFLNSQLRTRLGFCAVPSPNVEIKVELQDVRIMGSEPASVPANPATATSGNAKGVDLLQGYLAVEGGPFKTALGRQKMSLGSGRYLSTLEWSPTSRAFDGVSFNLNLEPGNLTGLAYLVKDTGATTTEDRVLLTGLYYSHALTPDFLADVYSFYDHSTLPATYSGLVSQNYDLYYLGERLAGKVGVFAFEEEFIWQMGNVQTATGENTSAAFQLATRAGVVLGAHKVNAGVDVMSGDDDAADDDATAYRANYYFAHAYYGWMDYFVNNPAFGVVDYRLDGDFGFLPGPSGASRVSFKPQYHFFTPQAAPSGSDEPYGQEIDLELHVAWYPKSNIVFGAAAFFPGDSASRLPAAKITDPAYSSQPGWFLYFMPTFSF